MYLPIYRYIFDKKKLMSRMNKKPLLLNKAKKKKARNPNRKIVKEFKYSKNKVHKLPKISLAS